MRTRSRVRTGRAGLVALTLVLLAACGGAPATTDPAAPETSPEFSAAPVAGDAVIVPASAIALSGEWQFAVDPAAAGEAQGWAEPGSCVFAANDEMAAGIVAAATAVGLAVPRDLAVVGFDDTRVARMSRPPLTTVRVPMSEMGAKAIKLLCQRISDPQRAPERISLKPKLIVRQSCGAKSAAD